MPVITMTLPDRVRSAIEAYAAAWAGAGRDDIKAGPKRLRVWRPHRLYRYMGADRGGAAYIDAGSAVGWRCFIPGGQGEPAMLDAFESAGRFAFRLHVGSTPARWLRLIRSARRDPRLAQNHYTMQTLLAPMINRSYLWFAPIQRGSDLFLEIRSERGGLGRRWMSGEECGAAVGDATARSAGLWRSALAPR